MDDLIRNSQAIISLTKPGPVALDARLILKPAKTWTSKAGVQHTGKRFWYVVDGETEFSTKCSEDNKKGAEAVLRTHERKKRIGLLGEYAPTGLTVEEVLDDHVEQVKKLAFTPQQKRRAEVVKNQTDTLKRFMSSWTLGEYTSQNSIDFLADYVAERVAYYDTHPDSDRKNPETTGLGLLRLLRSAVASFIDRRGILWSKTIHVPKRSRPKKASRWLRKGELARLLWACLYEFDPVTRRPKVRMVVGDDGKVRTIWIRHTGQKAIERYYLSRLIRMIVESGTRHEVSYMMMYGQRPDMPGIDCDSDGRGYLHRRGYEEEDTKKARPSSPISRRLARLVRKWSRMDGYVDRNTGTVVQDTVARYVILDRNRQPYRNHLDRPFKRLVKEVGLKNVSVHTLKHTAVNYAHQRKQTRRAAALMLGTTEETLSLYYTDWAEEASHDAILQSYDDPAKEATFRSLRHLDPLIEPRLRRFAKPFKDPKDG
jgi:integrase